MLALKLLLRFLPDCRACANALSWKAKCNGPLESLPRNFAGRMNSQNQQGELMSAMATSTIFLSFSVSPAGGDAHWETENRTLWNEQEQANEKRELVYEVSWIVEPVAWRCFLQSQRKAQN